VPRIHVLIADSKRVEGSDRCDILAAGIEAAVKADAALELAGVVGLRQVEEGVDDIPPAEPCAVVLTGDFSETDDVATRALARRQRLAVLQVTLQADVRMSLRAVDMPTFLSVLSSLAGRVIPSSSQPRTRVGVVTTRRGGHEKGEGRPSRPLLEAAQRWIHAVLLAAVQRLAAGKDAVPGITIAPASLAERMDAGIVGETVKPASMPAQSVEQVDAALDAALAEADDEIEPLARVAAIAGLTLVEFRILLLALAPELDPRYQSCYGLLLDDLGRRAGTLALCSSLIGNGSEIHALLARSGNLARWRLLEGPGARLPRADEPLRVDASLGAWLMGDDSALAGDAHVSRVLRLAPWAGARLFGDHERAARLVAQLHEAADPHWLVLAHGDAAGWRALLEVGAKLLDAPLIRVQAGRVPGTDVSDIHECGARLGRFARLTDRPLVIDAAGIEATPLHDDALRMLCTAVSGTGCRAAIVCDDATRTLGLLGAVRCTLHEQPAMTPESRTAAVESAARRIGIALEPGAATAVTRRFPLDAERLERVMRLAVVRIARDDDEAARLERFQATMREVAAEGLSGLADRVEPVFELSDVVLPADRSRQLEEIVYSVRLAPRVLDDWKFGERLPYGRGVTALFHGSSGTGKTMAAHGIARKLGVELLRFDLSRTVSKYIGETEKNIDRVFNDAERSGAAILIDEADALLGKRSEVKDAHDRYANIEVAYLLQRMEAYEGLAILTSNLRQNIDAAFLRRLRFVVEFPRPDVDAREKIWRRCLPLVAHDLDDCAFRLLARRIDLTGGHIVQVALRAAFAAAAEGVRIRLPHLQYASRAEFAKLGMPAVELEPSRNLQAA
jgi:hypothetical protein